MDESVPRRNGIWLCMVVKNEAERVQTAIRSALPLLAGWVVIDNGSTDKTAETVCDLLGGLPGKLVQDSSWPGFAAMRNQLFELAASFAPQARYGLVLDADDSLELTAPLPPLEHDGYELWVRDAGVMYRRLHLFRLGHGWSYRGERHNAPHCEGLTTLDVLKQVTYVRGSTKRRAPGRFLEDAAVLLKSQSPRAVYYAAQSFKDAGEPELARELYLRRAEMAGFEEERWHAAFSAARLARREAQRSELLAAFQARPHRAEPLIDLSRLARARKAHAEALLYSRAAAQLSFPKDDVLLIEQAAYSWAPRDEMALALYALGDKAAAKALWMEALDAGTVERSQVERLQRNADFCR